MRVELDKSSLVIADEESNNLMLNRLSEESTYGLLSYLGYENLIIKHKGV
jgi:hypothetical protein